MELIWEMLPMPNAASAPNTEKMTPSHSTFGAETVLDVVHRAAAPVALFVALTVLDREGDLGETLTMPKRAEIHIQNTAPAAEDDRAGDAGDVARADRGRQRRGDRLHRRDLAVNLALQRSFRWCFSLSSIFER